MMMHRPKISASPACVFRATSGIIPSKLSRCHSGWISPRTSGRKYSRPHKTSRNCSESEMLAPFGRSTRTARSERLTLSSALEAIGPPLLHWSTCSRHATLLPNDLDQHPLRPIAVELAVKDLLPRPEVAFALGDPHDDLLVHETLAFLVIPWPYMRIPSPLCLRRDTAD